MFFNVAENFAIGKNLTISGLGNTPSGHKRYENGKYVILQYNKKTAILNVFMDGNDYYSLTRATARKLDHIRENKEVTIFDSGESFKTKIEILGENDAENVYSLLDSVNNNYFKSPENLVALKFTKE